ncbi:acyl-CoA dehydrogenase family protein [Delftia tsuruhatensis]|uniref:acyl-CoA dehydrogenase family protein n=1 Tax=Delftia tsuruhatensis TaxID=180282 RepID=UPI0030D4529F
MDFDFSSEQDQLREAVSNWVRRSYTFERRRQIERSSGLSKEVYAELAALGLPALLFGEEDGGMGLGPVEMMVVMEELGRGIVREPLMHAFMSSWILAKSTAKAASIWREDIASGSSLVVLAYQEPGARYELSSCAATATPAESGPHWSLTGQKSLVAAGDEADAFIVPANTAQGMALFWVDRNDPGVALHSYRTLDGARVAHLSANGATAHLITEEGHSTLQTAVDLGIACICAEGIGVMEAMLAQVLEYLNVRKQFGVPLASFQALRHRVADMKTQLELARSMSYLATLKLNDSPEERHLSVSRAKYQLGCAMRLIGQQGIQLHGGIGMTDECVVSHYFKRLTQLEMTFGDTAYHLGQMSAACR